MGSESHGAKGYVLAALAGAVGGALAVAFSSHKVRETMSEMKSMRDECCTMMGRTERVEGMKSEPSEECCGGVRSASG